MTDPKIFDATIIQIMSAPAPMSDDHDNLTVGYALCEFRLQWPGGLPTTGRDIFPIGEDGCISNAPYDLFYKLHAFGDMDRPFPKFRVVE